MTTRHAIHFMMVLPNHDEAALPLITNREPRWGWDGRAQAIFDAPTAARNLIGNDSRFTVASVGYPKGETPADDSVCQPGREAGYRRLNQDHLPLGTPIDDTWTKAADTPADGELRRPDTRRGVPPHELQADGRARKVGSDQWQVFDVEVTPGQEVYAKGC